jgi:hypothetical protein
LRIDIRPDAVLAGKTVNSRIVAVTPTHRHVRLLCRPARAVAVLVLAMYVFAGALHAFHDFDVANASGKVIVSINKDGSQSEKGIAAEHHCHGCFSVSIPAPVAAEAAITLVRDVLVLQDIQRRGLPPGIDPPPPKFLT